jgi:Calcineurin-like phosphoesterase
MPFRRLPVALALCTLPILVGGGAPAAAPQAPPPRVVAVGDVHGAADQFAAILEKAGLIDAKRQWTGGAAVFVQTGDIFDRGEGVREALDLLMRLEDEARRAGGRVEALLGNHEVMNLLSDFRDVSPKAYAAFADDRSEDRRRRGYEQYARIARNRPKKGPPPQTRDEWMAAHPPGFIEYTDALGPRGKYGRWLRSHKVVTVVGDTAFMHAGVLADFTGDIEEVNRTVARDLQAWDDTRAAMVQARLVPPFCTLTEAGEAAAAEVERIAEALKANAPVGDHVTREFVDGLQSLFQIGKSSLLSADGPLWFRGFAQWPETDEPKFTALVQRLGVKRFVTAHTPTLPGLIRPLFGHRLFLIDTGMLVSYYKTGRPSALELREGRATAIYLDGREPLDAPGSGRAPARRFF